MANKVLNKTDNKSREFFEFVLPPVDMHMKDNNLIVTIDIPGFKKEDIRHSILGNILSIYAEKKEKSDSDDEIISKQRPSIIDKKIRLPIKANEEEKIISKSELAEGVLIIKIPTVSKVNDVPIEK